MMELSVQENMFENKDIMIYDNSNPEEFQEFLSSVSGSKVCFTGHRPSSLPWGYNENCELCTIFKQKLEHVVESLINAGLNSFISGLALGFDTISAETVLKLKDKYPQINLVLAIPCKNQSTIWKEEAKERYENIVMRATHKVFVSEFYSPSCFIKRNRYMVDNSDLIVACYDHYSKGTNSTIEYALKKSKKILILRP